MNAPQEKLEEVHYEQATADFYYLSELIKDYIGLVGAVKDVFAVSIFKSMTCCLFWLAKLATLQPKDHLQLQPRATCIFDGRNSQAQPQLY